MEELVFQKWIQKLNPKFRYEKYFHFSMRAESERINASPAKLPIKKQTQKQRRKRAQKEQKRCVVLGFGTHPKFHFKANKPEPVIKLNRIGGVKYVDACNRSCTIDYADKLYFNGVKERRIKIGVKQATSYGGAHFVVDVAGNLWSWGKNNRGQLGHDDTNKHSAPEIIDALRGKHVKEVIMNAFYLRSVTVACVTDDNTCFVWGNLLYFARLLYPKIPNILSVMTPIKLDRSIKSIAIGTNHALMIDINDDVFAIGDGTIGATGTGVTNDFVSWTKVTNLTGRPIKVQCGYCCSAVLTTTGLYTMGLNFGGSTPQLIELTNVVDISLTYTHILALTSGGELYAWGSNRFGQCGVGTNVDRIDKPTRVRDTEAYHIRQISVGSFHSLLRCEPKTQCVLCDVKHCSK